MNQDGPTFSELDVQMQVRYEALTEAMNGPLEEFVKCARLCDCTMREMAALLPPRIAYSVVEL